MCVCVHPGRCQPCRAACRTDSRFLFHFRFVPSLQVVAGAVLVRMDGHIDLLGATFQDNFATNSTDDGIGIVNHEGRVRCDATDCLQVCTECGDLAVPSSWPSSSPTQLPTISLNPTVSVPPTPRPTMAARAETSDTSWLVPGRVIGCLALWAGVMAVVYRCYGRRPCGFGFDSHDGAMNAAERAERLLSESPSIDQSPLLGRAIRTEALDSVELVGCSVMRSYELSLAPVFVVGSKSMCITVWSPGMAAAAPMLVDPVGMLVLDLPFVNPGDGDQLHKSLGRIFDARPNIIRPKRSWCSSARKTATSCSR